MTDWTAGYVSDVGYTFGYYSELNPLRVKLAFLNAGLAFPEFGAACELGFGQGVSASLHAAASVIPWCGTDFNPSQACFAKELATASDSGARFFDESFAEFANRVDLPEFDYIGLHGIWSWISDENRHVIVDFIRRKLKIGGVVYISYNTLPGWATFAPMRHLMTEHAEVLGAKGSGIVSRIDGALDFAEKLLATQPHFSRANPVVNERLKQMKAHDRNYLAHEYFNRDWHPMHFATMADWLEGAKIEYACSANYLDHVDVINLTDEQQALLLEIPDPIFRESVRDFIVNQQFRRDYWVKGARKLSLFEKTENLRLVRVVLTTYPQDVELKVTGSLGQANMTEAIYGPILASLSDHKIKTIAQIEQATSPLGINFAQLIQAILLLAGAGHLSLAQDEAAVAKARKHSDKINLHLLNKSRGDGDVGYLASPVTGGGVMIGRFQQLFLLAIKQGKKQSIEWAQFSWNILLAQGQQLVKDGVTIETSEGCLAELTTLAKSFEDKQMPILRALQII